MGLSMEEDAYRIFQTPYKYHEYVLKASGKECMVKAEEYVQLHLFPGKHYNCG